jgi:hypothetical protein
VRDGEEPAAVMTHRGLSKAAKALKVPFKSKAVQERLQQVAETQGVSKLDVCIDADDFEAVLAPQMLNFVAFLSTRDARRKQLQQLPFSPRFKAVRRLHLTRPFLDASECASSRKKLPHSVSSELP